MLIYLLVALPIFPFFFMSYKESFFCDIDAIKALTASIQVSMFENMRLTSVFFSFRLKMKLVWIFSRLEKNY